MKTEEYRERMFKDFERQMIKEHVDDNFDSLVKLGDRAYNFFHPLGLSSMTIIELSMVYTKLLRENNSLVIAVVEQKYGDWTHKCNDMFVVEIDYSDVYAEMVERYVKRHRSESRVVEFSSIMFYSNYLKVVEEFTPLFDESDEIRKRVFENDEDLEIPDANKQLWERLAKESNFIYNVNVGVSKEWKRVKHEN